MKILEVPYVVKEWRRDHPGEDIPDGHVFTQPLAGQRYREGWSEMAPMPSGAHQGLNRGRSRPAAATAGGSREARARPPRPAQLERRLAIMSWIIAVAFIAIVAWIGFRPRRSQR
jgi:hypothetical protein